jgi:hypothetical protein
MKTALILLFALTMLNLGVSIAKHGEPKNTNYNFFHSLIGACVEWGLIYWALA